MTTTAVCLLPRMVNFMSLFTDLKCNASTLSVDVHLAIVLLSMWLKIRWASLPLVIVASNNTQRIFTIVLTSQDLVQLAKCSSTLSNSKPTTSRWTSLELTFLLLLARLISLSKIRHLGVLLMISLSKSNKHKIMTTLATTMHLWTTPFLYQAILTLTPRNIRATVFEPMSSSKHFAFWMKLNHLSNTTFIFCLQSEAI